MTISRPRQIFFVIAATAAAAWLCATGFAESPDPKQADALNSLLEILEKAEADPKVRAQLEELSSATTVERAPSPEVIEHFELNIRPVLVETCFKCHGGEKTSNGLNVTSRESILAGGERGPAVAPGDALKSLLLQALDPKHEDLQMPPDGPLPKETRDAFARWIGEGAPWPESVPPVDPLEAKRHWAFQPVEPVEPPEDPSGWSSNPIDRFIKRELDRKGLEPNPPAEKRELARRVYYDLIGLPPTPEQMDAFLADNDADAYEKLIEELLASPHYGERWGRHWMDIARYSDTAGDGGDYPVPELRFYRDYIIDSFNADKPYDLFVREQLAGDHLALEGPREKYAEQVIATGFIALSNRFGTIPYQHREQIVEDSIDTVGRAFMGLTLKCARCHDHKFDPATVEDYYGLYGFFESTTYPYAGSETFQNKKHVRMGFSPLLPPEEAKPFLDPFEEKNKEYEGLFRYIEKESPLALEVAELTARISSLAKVIPATSENPEAEIEPLKRLVDELGIEKTEKKKDLDKELNAKRKEWHAFARAGLPKEVTGAYAVSDAKPVDTAIHVRGKPSDRGDVVPRGVPAFLSNGGALDIPEGKSGRLQLAEWLTTPTHPLTARVMVNRIWEKHFGKGIVASLSNFGLRGSPPTHPELLDWLATSFIENGWSIKETHRLILKSKTYRLSSTYQEKNGAADPSNTWYWRFDRRRLDAESIRDSILAVSGALDKNRPGRHPFPTIDKWIWSQHNPFRETYPSNHRSVYLMTQRIQRHPYLAVFDGPDTNISTASRRESTVPLQALFLLNDPFTLEKSENFSDRLLGEADEDSARVDRACRLAWGRAPSAEESRRSLEYLETFKKTYLEEKPETEDAERQAWISLARVILSSNEFVYID